MTTILLAACLLISAADRPGYARPTMLIEASELSKPDTRKKFVVLDARTRKEYEAGHVPQARWIDLTAWSKAINAGEDADSWSKRIGQLGIDETTSVVVYSNPKTVDAARVWWMLRYWGIADVRLLNGGWKSWLAAGGKSDTSESVPAARNPKLKREVQRLTRLNELLDAVKQGKVGQLIDTRSAGEHCGTTKTANRQGTIPGAKHLEWLDTLEADTGRVKSAEELTKLFRDAGLDLNKPVTTFCQSGGRAAMMAFVVELISGKPARNYYRSWAEWGNEEATPIVVPKK